MIKFHYSFFLIAIFIISCFPGNLKSAEQFRLWSVTYYKSGYDMITSKSINLSKNSKNPQYVLDYIFHDNKQYHPKIVLIKNGVAFVNIEGDSDQITNRSGSTGATYFSAIIVFNLTEFDNINFVYFVDAGEHFIPGKYERLDYWALLSNYRKNNYKSIIEQNLNPKNKDVSSYINKLAEIGDETSILKLEELKRNYIKLGYDCVDSSINETIKLINIKRKK